MNNFLNSLVSFIPPLRSCTFAAVVCHLHTGLPVSPGHPRRLSLIAAPSRTHRLYLSLNVASGESIKVCDGCEAFRHRYGDTEATHGSCEREANKADALMAYGLWLMAYGLWLMAYGLWLMAYGLWLMAYGLWLMAYGLWLMAYGLWLMAYGCCPPHPDDRGVRLLAGGWWTPPLRPARALRHRRRQLRSCPWEWCSWMGAEPLVKRAFHMAP